MSIDQPKSVDAIGVDKVTGDVILTITDHHNWSDVEGHLDVLGTKINAYLGFMESGEIFTEYPLAKGKNLRISIHFKYTPPLGTPLAFLSHASDVAQNYGFSLEHKSHEQNL